ncbi:MAG: response regulator [Bacteroidales bacterium]|nr:response regulator [Bacteroidales bacterium]
MTTKSDQPLIFIVDDDEGFCALVQKELKKEGYENIKVFFNGKDCLNALDANPDIVFLDYRLEPLCDGLLVLRRIKEHNKDNFVIMLTAAEKIELAIDSLRIGAYDFIVKNEKAFLKIKNRIKKIIREKQLNEKSR